MITQRIVTSAQQANDAHLNADVDNSQSSLHHTLGTAPSQGSQGDHTHDGRTSRRLYGVTPPSVTGSRGGNAALASLLTALAANNIITDNTTV